LEFALAEHQEHETHVVVVRGELDWSTAPAVQNVLKATFGRGATRVILDLAAVTFMDSTGLAVLVAAYGEAKDRDARFACVATDGVARRLVIWGLGHFVDLAADRDEAFARVAR
jgi:anti-sigma B factor antagonist